MALDSIEDWVISALPENDLLASIKDYLMYEYIKKVLNIYHK